jgi:hypothetical protein
VIGQNGSPLYDDLTIREHLQLAAIAHASSTGRNENAPEPAGYEAGSRGALEGGEVLRCR